MYGFVKQVLEKKFYNQRETAVKFDLDVNLQSLILSAFKNVLSESRAPIRVVEAIE